MGWSERIADCRLRIAEWVEGEKEQRSKGVEEKQRIIPNP
jgi:hypothetical protein